MCSVWKNGRNIRKLKSVRSLCHMCQARSEENTVDCVALILLSLLQTLFNSLLWWAVMNFNSQVSTAEMYHYMVTDIADGRCAWYQLHCIVTWAILLCVVSCLNWTVYMHIENVKFLCSNSMLLLPMEGLAMEWNVNSFGACLRSLVRLLTLWWNLESHMPLLASQLLLMQRQLYRLLMVNT